MLEWIKKYDIPVAFLIAVCLLGAFIVALKPAVKEENIIGGHFLDSNQAIVKDNWTGVLYVYSFSLYSRGIVCPYYGSNGKVIVFPEKIQ